MTFELDQKQTKGILENAVLGGENSVVTGRERAWMGRDVGLSSLRVRDSSMDKKAGTAGRDQVAVVLSCKPRK